MRDLMGMGGLLKLEVCGMVREMRGEREEGVMSVGVGRKGRMVRVNVGKGMEGESVKRVRLG